MEKVPYLLLSRSLQRFVGFERRFSFPLENK